MDVLGTRKQFEKMFNLLKDFETAWKGVDAKVDWEGVRRRFDPLYASKKKVAAVGGVARKRPRPQVGQLRPAPKKLPPKLKHISDEFVDASHMEIRKALRSTSADGLSQAIVNFWYEQPTAQALISGGAAAKKRVEDVFFQMWYDRFKDQPQEINPADMFRYYSTNKVKLAQIKYGFLGGMQKVFSATSKTNKHIYKGANKNETLRKFVEIIEDRDAYTKWREKHEGKEAAPKPPSLTGFRSNNIADDLKSHDVDNYLQNVFSQRENPIIQRILERSGSKFRKLLRRSMDTRNSLASVLEDLERIFNVSDPQRIGLL